MNPQVDRDWLLIPSDPGMAQLVLDQVRLAPIRRAVCKRFNVTALDLDGTRRQADLVEARHVAFFLAKKMTDLSYPRIGRVFGFRDHSTVMHGCEKVKWWLINDPGVEDILRELAAEAREEM